MIPAVLCLKCKHYSGRGACRAFPDGIPAAIIANEADHHEPYPGDNGIRFEPGAPELPRPTPDLLRRVADYLKVDLPGDA